MIARATHTRVNKIVSATVLGVFRLTAPIEDLARRERIHAVIAPAFLPVCLLLTWLARSPRAS